MRLSGRAAYRDELTLLAQENEKIVCLEADLGGAKHPFAAAHPDRFFNLGITELAGIDVAAGLAATGFVPFFSTFAPFAVLRAAESVKLAMGYMGLNVKLVAPYAGVAGAWFGTTHHCLEDLALLQSIPGITIAAPYGEDETRRVIREAAGRHGPFYIRLGRNDVFESLPDKNIFEHNWVVWQIPDAQAGPLNLCLVSVGERGTSLCQQAVRMTPGLAHAHLCYLDAPNLSRAAIELFSSFRAFLVVEEHRTFGGIASSLALLLPEAQVHGHNCGMDWPHHGGEHDDVLATLGFGLQPLLEQIHALDGALHRISRNQTH